MSVLYSVPITKFKCENEVKPSTLSPELVILKKAKINQTTSMPTATTIVSSQSESKPVLGQISMNHQQQKEPATKKRRVSDGSSTKVKPAPQVAVARRNARERNRVKQVNNGFSLLREHIPPEIADMFEQAGRGNAKKLSKVETLRMAVEYIRNLEQLLSLDKSSNDSDSIYSSNNNNSTFSNMSAMSETSLPATPPPETQQPFFYALKPHGGVMETQITIIGGQQYIRIPGTNTFQIVSHDSYENEENIHPSNEYTTIQIHPPSSPMMLQQPMIMNNLTPSLNFVNEMNSNTSVINSTPNSTETPAGSISPYSGHSHSSLSPAPSHHADNISGSIIKDGQFTTVIRHETDDERGEFKPSIPFAEHLMIQCASSHETSHYENIILKQEIIDDDGIFDESSLSNENMIDAMQWFEQQQNLNQNVSP
jgi:hypothetical protein